MIASFIPHELQVMEVKKRELPRPAPEGDGLMPDLSTDLTGNEQKALVARCDIINVKNSNIKFRLLPQIIQMVKLGELPTLTITDEIAGAAGRFSALKLDQVIKDVRRGGLPEITITSDEAASAGRFSDLTPDNDIIDYQTGNVK
jgi:hypothetical protein